MALTPQNNDAFFREVDEEVRREQARTLARRYGVMVIAAVLIGLIALAGLLVWRNHQETVSGERSEDLSAAMASLSAGAPGEATKKLDPLAKAGDGAYAPLARLLQADMLIQQNKLAAAAAAFLAVAHDADVAQPLRDLALVRATALAFDTLAPAEVVNRMKPLAVAGTPWFGSAGEMTGIALLKLNRSRPAGQMFKAVAEDRTVPQSIRARAGQIAADMGIGIVQAADTPRS